jgi:hypothetical protein
MNWRIDMGWLEKALRVVGVLLAGLYAYLAAQSFLTLPQGRSEIVSVIVGFGVVGLLWFRPIRKAFRVVALGHAAFGVALFHLALRRGLEDPGGYALFHIILPVAVGLLVVEDSRPTKVDGLPPGYEHLEKHRFYLSPLRKLGILAAVILGLPILMGGNMALFLVMLVAVPVWFAAQHLTQLFRSKHSRAPTAARRLKVRSQRRGPSQKQSYWTVNRSVFEDNDRD